MNEKLKIAVFVDYDNIEIGLKSTLQRDLEMAVVLDALKERGDIVAKFAYADWGRQESAKRQMAENAVQMVQRIPSPRGDKNGADINLALDALEMAFTHDHINAFAIISGDSDFIPLVNKLKEFGKTIFVVGGKAFTSTILQKNCHEFISFESLLDEMTGRQPREDRRQERLQALPGERLQVLPGERLAAQERAPQQERPPQQERQERPQQERQDRQERPERQERPQQQRQQHHRQRPEPLELSQAMPLVERALQVLERREVTPQLGLLKSTMLQLDPTFSEKAYGGSSFTEFIEKLRNAGYVNVTGGEGRYVIERKTEDKPPEEPALRPEEALPVLRDLLETHRIPLDAGMPTSDLEALVAAEHPEFDWKKYGFQEFTELLNYAQDKLLVKLEPTEEGGLFVHLGAEFYPPALPEAPPEAEPEPTADDQVAVLAAAEAKAKAARKTTSRKRAPTKRAPAKRSRSSSASDGNTASRPPARRPRKKTAPPAE